MDPAPSPQSQAFLAENPYAAIAARFLSKETLNVAETGVATALATMAVAFEARQSRFELDERLRSIETLARDGMGW